MTSTEPRSGGPASLGITTEDLKNSRPINWFRVGKTLETQKAVECLLDRLEESEDRQRKRRAVDRTNLRSTLEAVLLDSYATYKTDPTRFLAYTRRDEACMMEAKIGTYKSHFGSVPPIKITSHTPFPIDRGEVGGGIPLVPTLLEHLPVHYGRP